MIPPRRTRLRGFSRVFPKGITVQIAQLRALSGSNPRRGNKKAAGIRQSLFHSMVGRQGVEPWTLGLRVPCSTN